MKGIVLTIMVTACGCSSGGSRFFAVTDMAGTVAADGDMGGPRDGASAPDLAREPVPDLAMRGYPGGPYGNKVGETLADFVVGGYRLDVGHTDSSQLAWDAAIHLGDYLSKPACKCLVLEWCASWENSGRQQQLALVNDVAADPSFCVLEILQEGPMNGSGQVTMGDVTDCTQQFHNDFYVVQGTAATRALWNGWDKGGVIGLPFILVVNPGTMGVLGNFQGADPQLHDKAQALCR